MTDQLFPPPQKNMRLRVEVWFYVDTGMAFTLAKQWFEKLLLHLLLLLYHWFSAPFKKSGQEYEEWLSTCGIHFYTSSIVLQKRINHLRSQCILPLRAPDVSSALQNEESSLCPPGKGEGGVLLILSAEHMLQKVCLKEAAELHREEQLEKLTGQGSVYILSFLITVWTPACVCYSINACHCCISHLGPRLRLHFTWQQQEFPVTATLYGLPRSQRPSISGNFPPHPLPLTTCLPIWPYISGCGHLNRRGHLIQAHCLWAGFLGRSMSLYMWWQLRRYMLKPLKGVIQCPM